MCVITMPQIKAFQLSAVRYYHDGSQHVQPLFTTHDEAEWQAFKEKVRQARPIMRGNMVGHPSISKPVVVFRPDQGNGDLAAALRNGKLRRAPLAGDVFESVTALAEFMEVHPRTLLQAFRRAKAKDTSKTLEQIKWHGMLICYKPKAVDTEPGSPANEIQPA